MGWCQSLGRLVLEFPLQCGIVLCLVEGCVILNIKAVCAHYWCITVYSYSRYELVMSPWRFLSVTSFEIMSIGEVDLQTIRWGFPVPGIAGRR